MGVRINEVGRGVNRLPVKVHCQAVRQDAFRLVGERLLDLSKEGALLACDEHVRPGDRLLLSFVLPDGEWVDTDAVVIRVIEGRRSGDPGYCAGLRVAPLDAESASRLRTWLM